MKDIIAGWRQGNWGGGREEAQSLKTGKAQRHSTGCCSFSEGLSRAAKPPISHGGTYTEAGLSSKLAEKGVCLEQLPLVSAPINSALLLADKLLHQNGYSVSDNPANMVGQDRGLSNSSGM